MACNCSGRDRHHFGAQSFLAEQRVGGHPDRLEMLAEHLVEVLGHLRRASILRPAT